MTRGAPILGCLCAVLFAGWATCTRAAEPDWSRYGELLATYVSPGELQGVSLNLVDYAGLARDPRFGQVVQQIASYPLASLTTPAERIAFHINAYNILALKMVVDHWPLESIKDVGNLLRPVWKRDAGVIDGTAVSLDDVEHGRLRKMGQPLIHLAIVCASVSCPDLRGEPYRADTLDAQLEDQARRFLANPAKGVRVDGNTVHLSKIFDWFGEDFSVRGGVEKFVRAYRDLPTPAELAFDLPYHWEVNARR
jgi:hypothetical protein